MKECVTAVGMISTAVSQNHSTTGRQAEVAKSYQETQLIYKYDLNIKLYHEIRVKKKLWALSCGAGKFYVDAGGQDRVIQQWLLWF